MQACMALTHAAVYVHSCSPTIPLLCDPRCSILHQQELASPTCDFEVRLKHYRLQPSVHLTPNAAHDRKGARAAKSMMHVVHTDMAASALPKRHVHVQLRLDEARPASMCPCLRWKRRHRTCTVAGLFASFAVLPMSL